MSTYQAERLINELNSIAGHLFEIHQILCVMIVVLSVSVVVNAFRK